MLRFFCAFLPVALLAAQAALGQTGTPAIQPFDDFMNNLMTKHGIPGGSLAVVRNGKLVMARGYGMADPDKQVQAQPDTRYRTASLSKFVTSVAIMHLVEQGKLKLDQSAFALLPDLVAPPNSLPQDPRLPSITIANLLTHTGGWDDSSTGSSFDPMFGSEVITTALNVPAPASTENTIRYMRGQPLDFDPGEYYRYSNFGYAVLGRIIERVTGMSYEQYVRTNVLAPMGIANMRIGNTLAQGQLPGEAAYSPTGNSPSVFPDTVNRVPRPYGSWCVECQDAHGGWVTTVIEYARFMAGVEGRRGTAFLQPSSFAAMTARPSAKDWNGASAWYGFGIMVRPTTGGQNWWHSGSTDGTTTYQIRSSDGFHWIVFLNWRPNNQNAIDVLQGEIDDGLWNAAGQVTTWPATDYFATLYPDANPAESQARPAVNAREGVLNGATFDRGVVAGSWGTVYGVNLSKTTRQWSLDDIAGNQLPTSLDGVSVTIGGQPAFIAYVSPGQINFQAPSNLTPGWLPVEVINNGVHTEMVLAHVTQNAPGAFMSTVDGVRMAAATKADGAVLDGVHPAAPGDVIAIYATGIAPSQAGTVVPTPQQVATPAVSIGGMNAVVQYAGLVAPGLFQINVVVPAVSSGNQPLVITANKATSPADVFLRIAGN